MITTLKRKLLEKQRVQNRFASYEKYIGGHFFFYNVNATVSFGNHLTLSIFKFFTGLFVGFVTQLCTPSNVCAAWTHMCIHKAYFHLHHAWHSCSIFTGLWCGCSFIKLAFYLHHTPYLGSGYSRHNGTNNTRTRLYYGHTSSPRIPGLYHIQDIDCIKMADDHTV